MLAKTARISNSVDFAKVTKSGLRSTTNRLIGYLYLSNSGGPTRCGLIINRSVGNSVVRHQIARKIRHVVADKLSSLPSGSLLVIRTLPAANSADLKSEVTDLISKLIKKADQKGGVRS